MLRFSPSFRTLALVLGTLFGLSGTSWAQPEKNQPAAHCLLLPIEPAERARQSGLIVEAEVLDAHGFWDAAHRRLFTRHRLRVFSVLKGAPADTTGLLLITEGGRLGLDQQVLTNTLRLAAGQQGVFFLTPAPWAGLASQSRVWTPFGSEQGFIEYNTREHSATEPFRRYAAIDGAFYDELAGLSGQPRRVLRRNPALAAPVPVAQRGGAAPIIDGFLPQSIPAGAGAVLTINGSGFGNSRGSGFVEFRNADDGGGTWVQPRAADYVSWTDARIQVRVPSSASGGRPVSSGRPAGSGRIQVTTSGQLSAESANVLTVVYALTNVESTDGKLLQRPNHIALNATGGIGFRFGPNFVAAPPAVAAWQRALNSWRCGTGMNWEVGAANPTNDIADDNQNVVAFDASAPLPANVLGRTTSYYRGCYAPDGDVLFWVKEIDMQFDSDANFQFGPAPAVSIPGLRQIDFESVALHELGHAQQLNHLNSPGAVMHFAVASGQNTRTLSAANDVAGGRQVLRVRSFRDLGCSGPALLPAPLTGLSGRYAAGTGTTLAWTTRDECFVSGFAIERSLGSDTTAWEAIGTVTARPPAGQYQFTDARAPEGLYYYRLQVIRPNGSRDSAAPLAITTEVPASVSLFPNPAASSELRIQYPAAVASAVVFRCYDALGRQVRTASLTTNVGLNVLAFDLTGLAPGFYVLHWQDAQGTRSSRNFARI